MGLPFRQKSNLITVTIYYLKVSVNPLDYFNVCDNFKGHFMHVLYVSYDLSFPARMPSSRNDRIPGFSLLSKKGNNIGSNP